MILRYIAMRFGSSLLVLFGISVLTFLLIHLIPGNLVTILMGLSLSGGPQVRANLERSLHLNDPLPVQYLKWLLQVLHGNLGNSLINGFSVSSQIMVHLPVTIELASFSLLLALLIGVPLGVTAAVSGARWPDLGVRAISLLGLSTPDFFFGTLIIIVGSLYAPYLPVFGFVPFSTDPLANLELMFFPALTLGLALSAIVMRHTRSAILEVLKEPYVMAARAKGLARRKVIYKHALRNALIPVVTVTGVQGAYLIGGTVVIEQVFSLPGVGQLLLNSIYQRDYTMVQGTVLVVTVGVVLVNLIVDLLYYWLDPRIRA